MNFQQIIIIDIYSLAKDFWNCLTNFMHPTFFFIHHISRRSILTISFASEEIYWMEIELKHWNIARVCHFPHFDKPSIDFLLSSESFDQNIFIHRWNILKGLKNILVIHSLYRRKRVWEDEDRKGWDGWGGIYNLLYVVSYIFERRINTWKQ